MGGPGGGKCPIGENWAGWRGTCCADRGDVQPDMDRSDHSVATDDAPGGDLPPELLAGPTDIPALVARELRRGRRVFHLSNRVVAAWERRAPGHWDRFRRWLEARGIGVVRIDP